jgi:VanZ family protein
MLPVILVMAGIFYQSHQPGDSFSLPNIINIDKFLHVLVYAVLGLSFLFALPPHRRRQRPFLTGCAVVLFCLFYGAIDEFHQSFIPGRFAGGADLAADAGGGLLAAIGYWGWKYRQKQRGYEAAA